MFNINLVKLIDGSCSVTRKIDNCGVVCASLFYKGRSGTNYFEHHRVNIHISMYFVYIREHMH